VTIYQFVKQAIEANIESELKNSTTALINMIKTAADASVRNYLRAAAIKNREIIIHIYQQYLDKLMTEEEAKKMAEKILLSQTIAKTGYMNVSH
jgi:hypothetical protein